MLKDLIPHISHSCLVNAHVRNDLRVLMGLSSDHRDYLFSLVKTHAADNLLSLYGGINRIVHILEHAVHALYRAGYLHVCHDLFDYVMYHAFIYRHFITSFNMELP